MEHTGWSIETVRQLMATTRAADLVPLVRVPATEYHLLARPLDVGAMGLMVPMVESVAQAETIVRSAKYRLTGRRGAAFSVAHDDYLGGDIVEKMTSANEETLLLAQIETAAGVDAAVGIAALEGIDVLWIAISTCRPRSGCRGSSAHPDYLRAVDRVLEACARHGKTAGIMAADVETSQACLKQGFPDGRLRWRPLALRASTQGGSGRTQDVAGARRGISQKSTRGCTTATEPFRDEAGMRGEASDGGSRFGSRGSEPGAPGAVRSVPHLSALGAEIDGWAGGSGCRRWVVRPHPTGSGGTETVAGIGRGGPASAPAGRRLGGGGGRRGKCARPQTGGTQRRLGRRPPARRPDQFLRAEVGRADRDPGQPDRQALHRALLVPSG
jgi:2-dehydro-3-deoxyglucarate aldolase/4-hydroxy-2-oxoheptanedioate aldolase